MKQVKNFVVLGAGSMGAQIGALAAEAGFEVKIRDIEDKYLDRGRKIVDEMYDKRIQRGYLREEARKEYMSRISFLLDLKEAVKDADYIIEAVPEIMELKQRVFREVSQFCPADAVFATNTSSLSITEMAKGSKRPEMVVGTHYYLADFSGFDILTIRVHHPGMNPNAGSAEGDQYLLVLFRPVCRLMLVT